MHEAFNAKKSAAVNISVRVPQVFYMHTDHLNTPRVITNQAAQVVWRWDHAEPFGSNPPNENPSGLGTFTCNLRFPGQYFDKETNVNYNYFRDYDPAIGRYIQSDPIGLQAGQNTYSYTYGNPISFDDPTGLFTDCQERYLRDHYGSFVADTLVPYFSVFSLVNENREKFVTATAGAVLVKGPIAGSLIAAGRIGLAIESRLVGMFPIPILTPSALLYGTGVLASGTIALGGTAALAFASTADFIAARACAMSETSCGKQGGN